MTMVPRFDKRASLDAWYLFLRWRWSWARTPSPRRRKSQSAPAQAARSAAKAVRSAAAEEPQTKITPEQAQELFRSVDEILNFASKDTKLPIKHPVKRELAGREQVRKFVQTHMQEDKDAQRLQRSEASMKKFGLLPRDFDLGKFLLDLLEDQVAGYYDPKTKTVYLLDWVTPEAQRPVLAHELTHALQDQNFGLEKWLKVRDDDQHDNPDNLDTGDDEEQSARQAVSEGQGMAVMMDYVLEPSGHSLADTPGAGEIFKQNTMDRAGDSPIFASAPMYLREMVIFPYTYGLSFLEDLLTRGGEEMAFAGAFKNPPRDTREIMQPDSYLDGQHVEPHAAAQARRPAQEELRGIRLRLRGRIRRVHPAQAVLGPRAGGEALYGLARRRLLPWRKKDAKPPKPDAPTPMSDLGLLYVSNWATPEDAGYFAKAYSLWLPKKYKSVTPVAEQKGRAWTTEQGPVSIEVAGNRVLVMEGFDAATAAAVRAKVLARTPSQMDAAAHARSGHAGVGDAGDSALERFTISVTSRGCHPVRARADSERASEGPCSKAVAEARGASTSAAKPVSAPAIGTTEDQ